LRQRHFFSRRKSKLAHLRRAKHHLPFLFSRISAYYAPLAVAQSMTFRRNQWRICWRHIGGHGVLDIPQTVLWNEESDAASMAGGTFKHAAYEQHGERVSRMGEKTPRLASSLKRL